MYPVASQDQLGRDGRGPDSSVVARKRAFLLLEGHREALEARLRRRDRPSRRYEDLCVVISVIRLERDCLTESMEPRLDENYGPSGNGDAPTLDEGMAAEWARPWGERCLAELHPDLQRHESDLLKSRRWLSYWAQRKAETRAADRLDAISAEVTEALAPRKHRFPPH